MRGISGDSVARREGIKMVGKKGFFGSDGSWAGGLGEGPAVVEVMA